MTDRREIRDWAREKAAKECAFLGAGIVGTLAAIVIATVLSVSCGGALTGGPIAQTPSAPPAVAVPAVPVVNAPPTHTPQPAPAPASGMTTFGIVTCAIPPHDNHCDIPVPAVTIKVHTAINPDVYDVKTSNADGYALFVEPDSLKNSDISFERDGYLPRVDGVFLPDLAGQNTVFQLTPKIPPMPGPPTRAEILNLCITFQGLYVHTQQFGDLPWFEAALPWLTPDDRESVYAAKRASSTWCGTGDTHAILNVPSGPPLYDEPGQPYSADRFPALDWTNGGTKMAPQFVALLKEIIQNGFNRVLVMEGGDDGERGWPISMNQLDLIHDALIDTPFGDLRPYVVPFPGWDGVFYGATPDHIHQWVAKCRSLFLYCGFHHSTAHIPTGEGDFDWTGQGGMRGVDLLTSEFDDERFDDTVWQIGARLLGPLYTRDPEQLPTDDPGSPFGPDAGQFYLREPTDRGFIKNCALEFYEYTFVRGADPAKIIRSRSRFKARGWTCGG